MFRGPNRFPKGPHQVAGVHEAAEWVLCLAGSCQIASNDLDISCVKISSTFGRETVGRLRPVSWIRLPQVESCQAIMNNHRVPLGTEIMAKSRFYLPKPAKPCQFSFMGAAAGANSASRWLGPEWESFRRIRGAAEAKRALIRACCGRSRGSIGEGEIAGQKARKTRKRTHKRRTPRGIPLGVACQLLVRWIRSRSSGSPNVTLFELLSRDSRAP